MKADIYDFDKTIVPFDSGSLFVFYCMIHYPWCILLEVPILLVTGPLMFTGIISFTRFKKSCYLFIPLIPLEKAVNKFWDRYISKVNPWFYDRKRYSIVISASPDFLLNEVAKRLNFDEIISTRHNPKTGVIIGENCRGEEKIKRLYAVHKPEELEIVDVYSDSYKHDKYIFSLAHGKCYHIEKGKKVPFDFDDVYNKGKNS